MASPHIDVEDTVSTEQTTRKQSLCSFGTQVVGAPPTPAGWYKRDRVYHTQLAKMSFDKIFDLTAGMFFHF